MTLGVVLAGGRGLRLGRDEPKALTVLAGRTLLHRARATLEALVDVVVVSAPRDLVLATVDAPRVPDVAGAEGPLAGLVAALNSRPFTRAIVLAVDLPFASVAALHALGEQLMPEDDVVLAAPAGIPQPLAAWFAPSASAPLATKLAAGERSVTRAVLALRARVMGPDTLVRMPDGESAYFNLNTPADLAEAVRRCEEQRP